MGQYHDTNGRVINTDTHLVDINIRSAILAAGTPLAAFADGAVTTPGFALDDSESVGIRWNNHATPAAFWVSFQNPSDRRPGTDITLSLVCAKTGATVGDATTFTVTAFNQVVGALRDADANFGGTSGAITGNATSKTVQRVTLALASTNLETGTCRVSMSITPTAGLLGTDDITLTSAYLSYERALPSN